MEVQENKAVKEKKDLAGGVCQLSGSLSLFVTSQRVIKWHDRNKPSSQHRNILEVENAGVQ